MQHGDALRVDLAPAQREIARRLDAFGEPQTHQQIFVGAFAGRERLIDGQSGAAGLHAHQPAFRPPLGFRRIAASAEVEPAMRARSDAGIFVAAPIDQIVPALGARPRVIGNFVSRQAGVGADYLREIVEIAREILVGDRELAGGVQAEKGRLRFDGELIKREMLGGFGDGALELGVPGAECLARARVNEVERVAVEDRTRDGNRVERFLRACAGGRALSARRRRAPARRATRG